MMAPVGCGIGGLDWDDVRAWLEKASADRDIDLVAVTWEPNDAA